jgi:hypothetical protein
VGAAVYNRPRPWPLTYVEAGFSRPAAEQT